MRFHRNKNGSLAEIVFLSLPSEKKYQSTQTPKGKVPWSDLTNFKRKTCFLFLEKKKEKEKYTRCNTTLFKDSVASNCIYITLIHTLIKAPENLSETLIQNN